MSLKRRDFINLSAMAATTSLMGLNVARAGNRVNNKFSLPVGLKSMIADVVPISVKEIEARVAKAQRLLAENKMEALLLDCGTSLKYFTGISWWPSERTMVAIIPASGAVKYVCPGFEESRLREQIKIGNEVFAWQEDESPYQLIATVLNNSGIIDGNIAVEERVRFFIIDGIKKVAPGFNFISGDAVTIPCRSIKSTAELALMQKASDITVMAIAEGIRQLKEGMTPGELSDIIGAAHQKLGGAADGALCLFGEASAYPHGTTKPSKLKKGDIVLIDCGCKVQGYCSDISRTVVFGAKPTQRQQQIWNLEKQAQAAGFAAAQIGAACQMVDEAARQVIIAAGFGPGYKLPGLPHRTGHGIGMDGHEWVNMVKGNQQLLQPGMCFSIEPTIAIVGEFGVRMEDCVYMTNEGPQWFSQPAKSLEKPFG